MGTFTRSAFLFAASVLALAHVAPAHAQLSQSWVSGEGVDTNPCTRAAPCQTFSRAISVTNAGGSIECLDAGGYGNLTITKSIIIDCAGRAGGILALSPVSGVTVNGAGIKVVLRGLNIYGAGTGVNGIDFSNGASLHVENSTISRFSFGIYCHPPAGVTARLVVVDSSISEMLEGVRVIPTGSAIANVEILGSSIDRNREGLVSHASAPGSVRLMIENSSFSLNGGTGIAISGVDGAVNALISNSVIADNSNHGLWTNGSLAFVRISSTTTSGNTNGWTYLGGAQLLSFQDNGLGLNLSADGSRSGTIDPQ